MIVELVAGRGDIGRGLVVRRYFNGIDQAFSQSRRCDVHPGFAAIPRDMHEPVVATGPDDTGFVHGFRHITEGAVVFCTNGLIGIGHARASLL